MRRFADKEKRCSSVVPKLAGLRRDEACNGLAPSAECAQRFSLAQFEFRANDMGNKSRDIPILRSLASALKLRLSEWECDFSFYSLRGVRYSGLSMQEVGNEDRVYPHLLRYTTRQHPAGQDILETLSRNASALKIRYPRKPTTNRRAFRRRKPSGRLWKRPSLETVCGLFRHQLGFDDQPHGWRCLP